MAAIVYFDTPKTATDYTVQTTGTAVAHATTHVKITLNVTTTSVAHPRTESFYREVDFINTTFTDALESVTYTLAIVPQLYGSDTVQVSASWSH